MSEELFVKSFEILNDSNGLEEDKVSQIEALVREKLPDVGTSTSERLVLDILMAHHHKKDPRDAARAHKINTSFSKPVSRHSTVPEVEIPASPLAAPKPTPEVASSASSTAPVESLAASTPAVPAPVVPKEKTPFDRLREIFGDDNTDEDIERVLAHNDFHVERALLMLAGETNEIELTKEQMAARIMCRYFLSGNCVRGDLCMYSHDGRSRICRFWLHQRCIMGDKCYFMHDVPESLKDRFISSTGNNSSKPSNLTQTLPSLSALPTLGQKPTKKKGSTKQQLNSTSSAYTRPKLKLASIKSLMGEVNRGKLPMVAPRSVPWVATNEGVNAKYVELRMAAAAKAELRNKLLSESTTAWSLNDAARAKQLSARGREAEEEMIDNHRRAANLLWSHQKNPGAELWVDLHGLDLIEAIQELEDKLDEVSATQSHMPRIMYIITGRGHFKAKKYADQLTQYVLTMLDSKGYKHKDFGVHLTFGRITGVDPWSALAAKRK